MIKQDNNISLSKYEILDMIADFVQSTNRWWIFRGKASLQEVSNDLCVLFSNVYALSDLDEKIFWTQINDARRKYKNDTEKRIRALRGIVYFYVYIIKHHPELNLFGEARTLYPSLLDNRSFVMEWLEGAFTFMTYHPGLTYDSHDKYIFIIRGAENESSKLRSCDYIKVDLTPIISPLYRKCVFEYICSSVDRIKHFNISSYSLSLNCLSELKATINYKNPSESFLNSSEALFLLNFIKKKFEKKISANAYIATAKSFIKWSVNYSIIAVDDTFFDYLSVHRKNALSSSITRPDSAVLDTLVKASKAKAEKDPGHFYVFNAIVQLLLTTKLRISDICGLKRDCVRPAIKPGSYVLNHISKTSYGDEDEIVPITNRDKVLIDNVLAFTEPLVKIAAPELQNMLFLYIPNRRKYVRTPNATLFNIYMSELCTEHGLPRTVATSLRKEYQSQVKSFIIKNKKDDVEYKALSGHANIQTTEQHYAKIRIEEYFEQMYQVNLSPRHNEIKNKVVETIPANLERVGDTVNKCGACNSSECIAKLALPCFVCKNFITSKEFLPVFKRMTDEVSDAIVASSNPHDKEDLNAIKSILVSYIVELSRISKGYVTE